MLNRDPSIAELFWNSESEMLTMTSEDIALNTAPLSTVAMFVKVQLMISTSDLVYVEIKDEVPTIELLNTLLMIFTFDLMTLLLLAVPPILIPAFWRLVKEEFWIKT